MDNLNELGKGLNRTNKGINSSLRRIFPQKPITYVVRDIFDSKIPFEMEFETDNPRTYSLGLFFQTPPPSDCGGSGCFVGMCEYFQGTSTILTTTYEYITSSVTVYRDDVITTNYTKTGASEVTLGFTPSSTEDIKVCYVYQTEGCGCIYTDEFDRTVSDGWGDSTFGLEWATSDSGFSVLDGIAALLLPPATVRVIGGPFPFIIQPWWTVPFVFTSKFKAISFDNVDISLSFEFSGGFSELDAIMHITTDDPGIEIEGISFAFFSFSWLQDTYYNIKVEITDSLWRGKVWEDGDTEPDWLWSQGISPFDITNVAIRGQNPSAAISSRTINIEYISFNTC